MRSDRIEPTSNGHRRSTLAVFVLIDALGWEIINHRPFLDQELPVRRRLTTILGYSSGAIPAILTGQKPAENGRWNLFCYDPEGSPFKWLKWGAFLPDWLLDTRYSRKVIKELGRRVLGLGPLFECAVSPRVLPLFNFIEKQNLYGPGGIPGVTSIFDRFEQMQVDYRVYSYHKFSDRRIFQEAISDIRQSNASFYFLYLSEMDHFLHAHRSETSAVTERVAWYEAELRSLFAAARDRDPDARLTVASDHGMTPVHSHYDLVGTIGKLGLSTPRDYVAVYDSTMARYWFFEAAARRAIVAALERVPCGRILGDAEIEQLGVLFPDRRYGELIFLLDPGWLLAHSDFNGGGWQPAGMHGYHPSDSESDAIFLSNWSPRVSPGSIVEIFGCLEEAAACQ
jgi:hypothetical protein